MLKCRKCQVLNIVADSALPLRDREMHTIHNKVRYCQKKNKVKKPLFFVLSDSQPERINPMKGASGYDIKSDVWSLGITVVSCIL